MLTRERIAKELEAMIIEDSNPDKQPNGKYYSQFSVDVKVRT